MKEIYTFELQKQTPEIYEYTFISLGRYGAIKKIITFELIDEEEQIYNLLLEDEIDGERSGDKKVSNNGDPFKIINTIAAIIKDMIERNKDCAIYFAGSTDQRKQSYQRRVFNETNEQFMILGQPGPDWLFAPLSENVNYYGFLVFRR